MFADRQDPPQSAAPDPASDHPAHLLGSGREAFDDILRCIGQAEQSIHIRAFLWRDDAIGNALGRGLLEAAERGVQITIAKDTIAAAYEYSAGTRQSFFHKDLKDLEPTRKFQAWFLGAVYNRPRSLRVRKNPLARAILEHDNIKVEHRHKRFDHSKLFIFDDRRIILGSMGIGDAHYIHNVEMAVRLNGAEHVARLRERIDEAAEFDPARKVDFLLHKQGAVPQPGMSLLEQRLKVINSAERSLTIEMAYLGDPRFTRALLRAVRRGVEVKLVTSARSDVLGDLNLATCDKLLRVSGAPRNLTVMLLPRMVHAKAVVCDGRYSDLGSANFTPLSHGVYEEMNVHIDDPDFATALEDAIEQHCEEGRHALGRVQYRKFHSYVERAIVAYQGRRKKPPRAPRKKRNPTPK